MKIIFKIICLSFTAMILSSCLSTRLSSFGKGVSTLSLEDDEDRLWKRAAEEQLVLDTGGHIYQDEELEKYINSVLNKILSEEVKGSGLIIRAEIINDPRLNAFCFPNGTMYLHTGILARMDNEAQLAALLGHEMTHAINRHGVKFFRDVKNKTAFYNTFSVLASGLGGAYGQAASSLGAFGTLAAIYGYSRDNEREADENGFRMMLAAGYDIKEAPNLFRHLQEDFDKEKNGEPFFFGTHPRLQERIDSYEDLIKEAIPTGTNTDKEMVINEVQFLQLTHKLVLDNALFDISMGRFETAKQGIRKFLKQKPESTQGYYYLAEAYLHQSEQPPNKRLKDKETKEEKRQKAIEYYQKAIETDPGFPLPYKAVGILYFKEGEKDKARERLTKYLELSADGQDAAYVKGYLERLGDGKR